tara:strand:- start:347 stop:859 length:513 start_codon:yes stop_codon:yes gene_type:complete
MDNIVKAKIIIELLDDRKYSVLSSFNNQELSKFNNVDLEVLNNLSNSDINNTVANFLANIDKRKEASQKTDDEIITVEPIIEKKPTKPKKSLSKKAEGKMQKAVDKIQQQPPQLIACVLNKIDDSKRSYVLSKFPSDKKQLIESIEVETVPISDQVVNVILKELELTETN